MCVAPIVEREEWWEGPALIHLAIGALCCTSLKLENDANKEKGKNTRCTWTRAHQKQRKRMKRRNVVYHLDLESKSLV